LLTVEPSFKHYGALAIHMTEDTLRAQRAILTFVQRLRCFVCDAFLRNRLVVNDLSGICDVNIRKRSPFCKQLWTSAVVLMVAFGLAACGGGGVVKQAAELSGFAKTPSEPAQFVRDQRPETADYIPIGRVPPSRDKIKTQAEIKQAEAALDGTRSGNETLAVQAKTLGATPPPALPTVPPNTN
jgi:hypothetical protein